MKKKISVSIVNKAFNGLKNKSVVNLFKKPKSKAKNFKNIEISCGENHFVISWAKQGVGFGEVTFYIQDNNLMIDDEKTGKEFYNSLIKETFKRVVNGKIKINRKNLLNFLLSINSLIKERE